MREQQKTFRTPLLLILMIGIFGTKYVAASPPGLTTLVKVESTVVGTAIDDTKLAPAPAPASPLPHRRLKKRGNGGVEQPTVSVYGAVCEKSFYSVSHIGEMTRRACPKIQKAANSKPSKIGGKLRACAPNVPYCNYNSPLSYQGPPEYFKSKSPLFVWPIVSNRLQKLLGLKGSDRIVISLNKKNICEYHGLVRKNWRGKWNKCDYSWRKEKTVNRS